MAFLDNIKDRLGFGNTEEEEEFDEELYGESFDAYAEDFDNLDENFEDQEQGYSAFAPISTRSAGSGRRSRSYEGHSSGGPQLVSLDDVRNSTRIPESLNRDPLPPRRTESYRRNSVGHASDYALSGSEASDAVFAGSAAASTAQQNAQSSMPQGPVAAKPASAVGIGTHPAGEAASSGYDPYRVYEAGGASSHRPTRSVSVISPVSYNEVENVARMLRAGDAVVLSLRNTPSQLSKRILDFSFGVASALDATVDCIADKVFAITRISGLSEDELSRLRSQGVI